MRGFSALIVFFVHFHTIFGSHAEGSALHSASQFLSNLGHCGVDVFFALSGFIIYGHLMARPVPYFRFLGRRIVRLYPAFTAVFLFYVAVSVLVPAYSRLPDTWPDRAAYLLSNYLMLPGMLPWRPMITVAWSLSYEVFFYTALPLAVAGLRLSQWPRVRRICFWLALSCLYVGVSTFGPGEHPRLVMFACGILLWEAAGQGSNPRPLAVLVAPWVFLLYLGLAGLRPLPASTGHWGGLTLWSALVLASLFVGTFLLGYAALSGSGFLPRLFSWAPLRYLGNMSYSYYLIHGATLLACREALRALPARLSPPAFLALALACFAVTILAGSVLFLTVEKPLSLPPRLPSGPRK